MRIAVTGGRDFNDVECVHRTLNALHQQYGITELAHGKARGADSLSGSWAIHHGVTVVTYEANWRELGKRAGVVRNEVMLREFKPDVLVVFPGGVGTAHCTHTAKRMNIPTIEAVVLTATGAPRDG